MNPATFIPRATCLRCRLALAACWCESSTTQDTRAELVLLQHPRESRNPIGTARMAHLAVPGSQIRVGIDFAADAAVAAMLSDGARRNVVLYPTADSRPAEELRDSEDPLRIFILDGTWWQAKKLWQRNLWLHGLPAYRLTPKVAGQYRIRREPAAHCLATIEAVAQLLDVLAGEPRESAALLKPFHVMVERQLAHAQSAARAPRIRTRPRSQPVGRPQQELVTLMPRLLLVHAEGNGWPRRNHDGTAGGDVELLQWLAIRPSTGEVFHALVQTQTRSLGAPDQQELSAADLASAVPKAEFLAQWEKFIRPADAWCSWGYLAESLMKQSGGVAPATINLQRVCNAWLGRRLPHVEDALAAVGSDSVVAKFPGRGGRRIAAMATLVRALTDRST